MNPQYPKPQKSSHNGFAVVVLLLLLAVLGGMVFERQNFLDWWHLRNYQAPAAVAQLASADTMTSYARKVFYVNEPQLEAKSNFTQCSANKEQTIVLGCYHGGQSGIYVLSVDDPRLTGVEQVTSAHEMLHAAYDRLSARERQKVNAMLQDYYDHDLHDQRVIDTIALYKKSEPKDVVNEMHSIFGTEVASLPAPLEQYYAQYFTNRGAITTFAAQYQGEFTSRQAAIKNADDQLASLKAQIDSTEADLRSRQAALSALGKQLDASRAAGDIAAYNAGVPVYNRQVAAYNGEVDTVKSLIARYNDLVGQRNAIAAETQQLTDEISSQVAPIGQ